MLVQTFWPISSSPTQAQFLPYLSYLRKLWDSNVGHQIVILQQFWCSWYFGAFVIFIWPDFDIWVQGRVSKLFLTF